MAVIGRFDTHVAILLKGHRQLVVHKLVNTQVLIVTFAGIIGAVDIAEEVELIDSRLFITADAVAIDIVIIGIIAKPKPKP